MLEKIIRREQLNWKNRWQKQKYFAIQKLKWLIRSRSKLSSIFLYKCYALRLDKSSIKLYRIRVINFYFLLRNKN